jgi:hypothetical protein
MSDTKGNTPQDRRAVALSEEHERRHFIDQFVKDHPDSTVQDVEGVLDVAAASIAPSEDRPSLIAAVERKLGLLLVLLISSLAAGSLTGCQERSDDDQPPHEIDGRQEKVVPGSRNHPDETGKE